ncbi:hypothetical protein [uncultured Draconibacterium sp.]|uniref:hypothetical protein n=1 Tax=uncultured Draconibacterium sp. TaxID=1573823 RepID=UPI00326030DF
MRKIKLLLVLFVLFGFQSNITFAQEKENEYQGIKIYNENTWYWQYHGKPVILRGGSNDDNLFQWTGKQLTDHLDLLQSATGNYVRNSMSDRDEGNVYAFKKVGENTYDLNQWNEEYWNRLTFFLEETSKREIIVQLTLWDHFDIGSGSRWKNHPWNPERNINMDLGTWKGREDFYSTVDRNAHDELNFQNNFIKKLLSISLKYDNVLYNINNESSESEAWENYWAAYVKDAANEANKQVFVTNMQLSAFNAVRHVMSKGDIFDYVDISQTNQDSKGARGPAHWDYLMFLRQKIASYGPIPMNNVKIYGASDGSTNFSAGSETEAVDRFWRNIFGGCASARFHRPSVPSKLWGSGINKRVQTNLKAMDMLLKKLDIFNCNPHNDLLIPRVSVPSMMQAYVTANIGRQYAVYFPQGRYKIDLDPWVFVEKVRLQWLDVNSLKWSEPQIVEIKWDGGKNDWGYRGLLTLETPSNRQCVAFIEIIK